MKRGDVVVVAASGDYGKPRPAVVIQNDALSDDHASVIVCQMTSNPMDTPDFRIAIEPNPENGLRLRSQIMVDKPMTVRRQRVGQTIGHLTKEDVARLDLALAFVMGLADR
jgi:mRNA interferase MazF